jgi:adenylate cyclase
MTDRLPALRRREEERFAREHPRSRALAERANEHLLAGVTSEANVDRHSEVFREAVGELAA